MDNSFAPTLNTDTAMPDRLPIIVRAYVPPPPTKEVEGQRGAIAETHPSGRSSSTPRPRPTPPSNCGSEPTRCGEGAELREAGIFFDPQLSDDERTVLREYARAHNLQLLSKHEFIEEIFYGVGYDLRATIVGFNLPSISLASPSTTARLAARQCEVGSPFSFPQTVGSQGFRSSIFRLGQH